MKYVSSDKQVISTYKTGPLYIPTIEDMSEREDEQVVTSEESDRIDRSTKEEEGIELLESQGIEEDVTEEDDSIDIDAISGDWVNWLKDKDGNVSGIGADPEDGILAVPRKPKKKEQDPEAEKKSLLAEVRTAFMDLFNVTRHHGPGRHPGTNTAQTVHGNRGGAGATRRLGNKHKKALQDWKAKSDKELRSVLEEAGYLGEKAKVTYPDEVYSLAAETRKLAEEHEPVITELMKNLIERVGGELSGEEFRLKAEDSLARKIFDEADDAGISFEEATAEKITDSVRYTMLFDPETYTQDVLDTQEELEREGWTMYDTKWRNYFKSGDDYDGYNTVMENKETGMRFELQYHTHETIDIKFKSHVLYEASRGLEPEDPEIGTLWDVMSEMWAGYDKPKNWENLPGEIVFYPREG